MEHPKTVGDRSALATMLALHDAGYSVSVPFGENSRYDLVVDDGRRLARVQCKTGRLRSGAVRFNACSFYAHHPNPRVTQRPYLGEVDYFCIYCPETSGVYLVPIAEVSLRRQGALRIDPPRNNQIRKIRFAADYEIGRVELRAGPGGRPGAGGFCA